MYNNNTYIKIYRNICVCDIYEQCRSRKAEKYINRAKTMLRARRVSRVSEIQQRQQRQQRQWPQMRVYQVSQQ